MATPTTNFSSAQTTNGVSGSGYIILSAVENSSLGLCRTMGCPFLFIWPKDSCEFNWFSRSISRKRVPKCCPRHIPRRIRPPPKLNFFKLALLGELEHNGGKMHYDRIRGLFPVLKLHEINYILNKLKREGKIFRQRGYSDWWKLCHAVWGKMNE